MELARQIDNTRGIAWTTVSLGWVELLESDIDSAASGSSMM